MSEDWAEFTCKAEKAMEIVLTFFSIDFILIMFLHKLFLSLFHGVMCSNHEWMQCEKISPCYNQNWIYMYGFLKSERCFLNYLLVLISNYFRVLRILPLENEG